MGGVGNDSTVRASGVPPVDTTSSGDAVEVLVDSGAGGVEGAHPLPLEVPLDQLETSRRLRPGSVDTGTAADALETTHDVGALSPSRERAALQAQATLLLEARALIAAEQDQALANTALITSARAELTTIGAALTPETPLSVQQTHEARLSRLMTLLDAEIGALTTRLDELQPLAHLTDDEVRGKAGLARRRAEARLALDTAPVLSTGEQEVNLGSLSDRLNELRSLRTYAVSMHASLRATTTPTESGRELTAGLRRELTDTRASIGQQSRALAALEAQGVATTDPRHVSATAQLQQLRDLAGALEEQATALEQRWVGVIDNLSTVARLHGIAVPAGKELADVAALVESLERSFGIRQPGVAVPPLDAANLGTRLIGVEMAEKQGVALGLSWLAADTALLTGSDEQRRAADLDPHAETARQLEQLVADGLLSQHPNSLSAEVLSRYGLDAATPGALTADQQRAMLLACLPDDPQLATRVMERLHALHGLQGRDGKRDGLDLIRVAQTGQGHYDYDNQPPSFFAAREERLRNRERATGRELLALAQALVTRPGISLEGLSRDPSLSSDLRHTAGKLLGNARVSEWLEREDGPGLRARLDSWGATVLQYEYEKPDLRILREADIAVLDGLVRHFGRLTPADFRAALTSGGPGVAPRLNGVELKPEQISVLSRVLAHDGLLAAVQKDGRFDRGKIGEVGKDTYVFQVPPPPWRNADASVGLSDFVDPERLQWAAETLYDSMKGAGTANESVWLALESIPPGQRDALRAEFTRVCRARGESAADSGADALDVWLRADQGGWQLAKSQHLLNRQKMPEDYSVWLRSRPVLPPGENLFVTESNGHTYDLGTAKGRLELERHRFSGFRQVHGVELIEDEKGVRAWRAADAKAGEALLAYEQAVVNGDSGEILSARALFTRYAGEAMALHRALGTTLEEQHAADVVFYDNSARYVQTGAVVLVATAVTIGTAGAASAAGASLLLAAAEGAAVGTLMGTIVGTEVRAISEWVDPTKTSKGRLDRMLVGGLEDFRLAAGSAVAAAIPTAAFGRVSYLAANADKLSKLTGFSGFLARNAVVLQQGSQRAFSVIGGGVTGLSGSMGNRVVHEGFNQGVEALSRGGPGVGLRTVTSQVDTTRSIDNEISLRNAGIELVSGAIGGYLNHYASFLERGDDVLKNGAKLRTLRERLGASMREAIEGAPGLGLNTAQSAADQAVRNWAYGRAIDEGLVDNLIIGLPTTLAVGLAVRRNQARQKAEAEAKSRAGASGTSSTEPGNPSTPPVRADSPEVAAHLDEGAANLGGRTRRSTQLTSDERTRLGGADGEKWFADLVPKNKMAALLLFDAADDVVLPFDSASLEQRIALVRRGLPVETVAHLPDTVLKGLVDNLPSFQSDPLATRAPAAGKPPSEAQKAWQTFVAEAGDMGLVQGVLDGLRPTLAKYEWRLIATELRESESGRGFLANRRRSAFARNMAEVISGRPEGTTLPQLIADYRAAWDTFKTRHNARFAGREGGFELTGDPPGLDGAMPKSRAELLRRVAEHSFGIYSGTGDPASVGRTGYAGDSHRVRADQHGTRGKAHVHLESRVPHDESMTSLERAALSGENTRRYIGTLLHEVDHVSRAFAYQRANTPENVAHNLVGELLAQFHTRAVQEPEALRALLTDKVALREFASELLDTYRDPGGIGPDYFKTRQDFGSSTDPIDLALRKLEQIQKAGGGADPLQNLVDAILDPRGTGMLGNFDENVLRSRSPLRPEVQERLRRAGISDEAMALAVHGSGWDAQTGVTLLALLERGYPGGQLGKLKAAELDSLLAAVAPDLPRASSTRTRGPGDLSPERLTALAANPDLQDISPTSLRALSDAQFSALVAFPGLGDSPEGLLRLQGLSERALGDLVVRRRAIDASPVPKLAAGLAGSDAFLLLEAVQAKVAAGTLQANDPTLLALLRRLPPRSSDGVDQGALTAWLGRAAVPARGMPLSTLDPAVVPPGADRSQLVGQKARQMLEAAGFDKTLLGRVSDSEAQALWVAHFNQGHDHEAQGSLLASALSGSSDAARSVATAIEQRALETALGRYGVNKALFEKLSPMERAAALELATHLWTKGPDDPMVRFLADELGRAQPNNPKSSPDLSDRRQAELFAAFTDAQAREALVALGAKPEDVRGLSNQSVAQLYDLRRLRELPHAEDLAAARLDTWLDSDAGKKLGDVALRWLGQASPLPPLPPDQHSPLLVAQQRRDLIALGVDPAVAGRLEPRIVAALHELRTNHWTSAADAEGFMGKRLRANKDNPLFRNILAQLRGAQEWGTGAMPTAGATTRGTTTDDTTTTRGPGNSSTALDSASETTSTASLDPTEAPKPVRRGGGARLIGASSKLIRLHEAHLSPELLRAFDSVAGKTGKVSFREWFEAQPETTRRALVTILDDWPAGRPLTDAAHLQGAAKLVQLGVHEDVVLRLPADAVVALCNNLGSVLRLPFDPEVDGPRSAPQQVWDDFAKKVNDADLTQQVALALGPDLKTHDWRAVVDLLRQTTLGRQALGDFRRNSFARGLLRDVEARFPANSTPNMQEVLAFCQESWVAARDRYNTRMKDRGVSMRGELPPGLDGPPPTDLAALRERLIAASGGVFSGADDPFLPAHGYTGKSERAPGENIHLMRRDDQGRHVPRNDASGPLELSGTTVERWARTLVHEQDHLLRGFDYIEPTTADDVAHNLLGEGLAELRELVLARELAALPGADPKTVADFGPGSAGAAQLDRILSDPRALREFLGEKLEIYGRPRAANPWAFRMPDGVGGDPLAVAMQRILAQTTRMGGDPRMALLAIVTDPAASRGVLGP